MIRGAIIFVMVSILLAAGLPQNVIGQTTATVHDSLKSGLPNATATPDRQSRAVKPDTTMLGKEMELESIAIEAIIEKPNVDIIPRRVKPDFGEVEFIDRSFERELRAVPKDLLLGDDELDRVARLEGLKKVLEKKKKK